MNKKAHTKIHKQTTSAVFDEVLVFELDSKSSKELNQASIILSVMDANTISRDVLIGSFQFDLSMVYFSEHHEIYKQWYISRPHM